MIERPRLKDVARSAGVGAMTVSRVLNGGSVGSEKTARVHDAMRRLNYRPDQLARSLRTRRTRILGLVVPRLSDPFFAAITDSVNTAARSKDYALLLATTSGDPDLELKAIREMLSRRVDGLLFVPSERFSATSIAREVQGTRIIAIDQPVPRSRIDLVGVNNFDGAVQAVKHLISHGHTRIICISESNSQQSLRERQDGYSIVMADHGLKPSLISDYTSLHSTTLIRSLLADRGAPSAIVSTNSCATIRVLRALRSLRIRVPDEVALIGFDDLETADLLSVPLSAVRQPAAEMGRAAAERMIEQLQTESIHTSPQILKLPAELIVRQSCGCTP